MKQKNLFFLFLSACVLTANAQTTIVSLGFEEGDTKYTTDKAYTPGGTYGDWVNLYSADVWNERCTDARTGNYCLKADNSNELTGNTWDRGFKVGNLKLEDNTSYRVSFWVRAKPEFLNDGSNVSTKLKTSLAIGQEYFDMPISTAAGDKYYYNYTEGMTGEWRHISYLTYFTNKADLDALSAGYSGKTDPNGNMVSQPGDPFPDAYFLTINMYNPGIYYLDDIKIEKNATFNTAGFYYDTVKLDFGYPTNIADLAKQAAENGTVFSLPPTCAQVIVNGEEIPVSCIEAGEDGFLYIFLNIDDMGENADVKISFIPTDDCPILYTSHQRPSADVVTPMHVLAFHNETAYYDDRIDVLPSYYAPPKVLSTYPENNSFNLKGETFSAISVTYNKPVKIDEAIVMLSSDSYKKDFFGDKLSLSEDGCTMFVNTGALPDGTYNFELIDIYNLYNVAPEERLTLQFVVGEDDDVSTIDTLYVLDLENYGANYLPLGWCGRGDNGSDRVGSKTETFGGAPRTMGSATAPNHGIYFCQRGGSQEGYLAYGLQALDAAEEGGSIPEELMPYTLYFAKGKYKLSYKMASWDGVSGNKYNVEVTNKAGGTVLSEKDIVPLVTVKSATTDIDVPQNDYEFNVTAPGYYYVMFTTKAGWGGFLLTSFDIVSMPNSAASYYNQLLAAAISLAKETLEKAGESCYDGQTKTLLTETIAKYEGAKFTSPSQYNAVIAEIQDVVDRMNVRYKNYNQFEEALFNLGERLEALTGKYVNAKASQEADAVYQMYANASPASLEDDELQTASYNLAVAAEKVKYVGSVVDILTYRGKQACRTARALGVESALIDEISNEMTTDDTELVERLNGEIAYQLYTILSKGQLEEEMLSSQYYDGSYAVNDNRQYEQRTGEVLATEGVDMSCFINNPHFYTYETKENAKLQEHTITGWTCEQPNGSVNISGDYATVSREVVDVRINAYAAGCDYDFYQEIKNLPVGIYDIYFGTRTGTNSYTPEGATESVFEPYNGYNDETLIWDKYIFARTGDGQEYTTPFAAGASGVHPTVIKHVTITENATLTIGIKEHYQSGKATKNGKSITVWDTNTTADDARLYFVGPLPGYDYAKAADGVEVVSSKACREVVGIYNANGLKIPHMKKGINIVKYADGTGRCIIR